MPRSALLRSPRTRPWTRRMVAALIAVTLALWPMSANARTQPSLHRGVSPSSPARHAAPTAARRPVRPALAGLRLAGAGTFHGGVLTLTYTLDVTGDAAEAVVLTTQQDPRAPADATTQAGVRVDRQPLGAGRVQLLNGQLIAQLGTLGPGRHAISFPVPVPATERGATDSSASVTSTGTSAVGSGPVRVAVNQADLRVRLSSEAGTGPVVLGDGRTGSASVDVDNAGSTATAATLTVTLPAGLSLGPAGVQLVTPDTATRLSCATSGPTTSCPLGPLAPSTPASSYAVQVLAGNGAAPGAAGSIGFALTATPDAGLDSDPADNTVSVPVSLLGTAVLSGSASPSVIHARPGQRVTLTMSLTNAGPQTAPDVFAAIELDQSGSPTSIVSVTGDGVGAFRRSAHAATAPVATPAAATPPVADVRFWSPPDMAPGRRVTARVVLSALRPGRALIRLAASSTAGDPGCADALANCYLTTATIVVSAATSSPRPTPHPPTAPPTSSAPTPPVAAGSGSSGGPGLANTGSDSGVLTTLGLGLLLAGAAVLVAERRRSRRPLR